MLSRVSLCTFWGTCESSGAYVWAIAIYDFAFKRQLVQKTFSTQHDQDGILTASICVVCDNATERTLNISHPLESVLLLILVIWLRPRRVISFRGGLKASRLGTVTFPIITFLTSMKAALVVLLLRSTKSLTWYPCVSLKSLEHPERLAWNGNRGSCSYKQYWFPQYRQSHTTEPSIRTVLSPMWHTAGSPLGVVKDLRSEITD